MDILDIVSKSSRFKNVTFRHLAQCLQAYENKEYLSTVIKGAVFAEALLEDIGKYYKIVLPSKDAQLNTLIERVSGQIRKREDVTNDDKVLLVLLAGRCDEIRLKRNRLVHNNGIDVTDTDIKAEATDVYSNVLQVASQYTETTMATQHQPKQDETDSEASAKHKFSVFISTITPHSIEQALFINSICEQLEQMGIEPVRCQFDDYDKRDPMKKVLTTIASCDAILVIGLERTHSYIYRDKEHSVGQTEGIHRKYSSGWLHLESGVAMALKKEIFVICHEDIYGDGIFDRDWNSYTVVEFTSPLNVNDCKIQVTLRELQKLAEAKSSK